jgi:hypothetical protein
LPSPIETSAALLLIQRHRDHFASASPTAPLNSISGRRSTVVNAFALLSGLDPQLKFDWVSVLLPINTPSPPVVHLPSSLFPPPVAQIPSTYTLRSIAADFTFDLLTVKGRPLVQSSLTHALTLSVDMPPARTMPPAKAVKTERTHEENQERYFS